MYVVFRSLSRTRCLRGEKSWGKNMGYLLKGKVELGGLSTGLLDGLGWIELVPYVFFSCDDDADDACANASSRPSPRWTSTEK